MSTSKIDTVHIPRDEDGRFALRLEDEPLVLEDLKTMTRNEVCGKWGISRTKVFWLLNPDKYKAQLERNRATKTYDTKKATEYKQRNRAKKRKLMEKANDTGKTI